MRLANSMAMYLLSALGFARAEVARVGILKDVPAAWPRPIIEIPDLDSIKCFFLHAFGA
jgi:hypothetical protein